jgi:hypothetical protein
MSTSGDRPTSESFLAILRCFHVLSALSRAPLVAAKAGGELLLFCMSLDEGQKKQRVSTDIPLSFPKKKAQLPPTN